jgi:metal transporter CNNM
MLGGHEADTYKKAELKSFLQFHRHGEEPLRDDEIVILNGVLELNSKRVTEIMTPMKDVVTLSIDTVLDHDMVDRMCVNNSSDSYRDVSNPGFRIMSGYSRFPVHEAGKPQAFVGLLLVKKVR